MPTAAFHPNGTLFAVCGNGASLHSAPSRAGPWSPLNVQLPRADRWEDPTLWFDRHGHFHIINHVYSLAPFSAGEYRVASGHMFSRDGLEWHRASTAPFDGTVELTDGTSVTFATRERPQLIFSDVARTTPVGLTSAVSSQPIGPMCDTCEQGACSQCKVTDGRDWTYTIYQPLGQTLDSRSLSNGTLMLRSGYLDQPYCDVLPSKRWICTITGSAGAEGSKGEHVAALWSDDAGKSWSKPVPVEPEPNTLPNAYSMTLVAPATGPKGRVYTIYNMNVQNITHDGPDGPSLTRTDMMGGYFLRYSDDEGATWSSRRYPVPFRLTSIDTHNEWNGTTTIGWSVDQLKVRDGVAYFAFTKIGKYLLGPPESLWVLKSANLLSAKDAADIKWELLPDGDDGIRPMQGQEQTHYEEAHVLPLTGVGRPGFYVAGRTTVGWIVESRTADGTGRTGWSPSAHAQYFDPRVSARGLWIPLGDSDGPFGGALSGLKNPRGPITMKHFEHLSSTTPGVGCYLLLFYNNNVRTYTARNPYWLSVGWEVAGVPLKSPPTVLWSQPEVVLYDADDHSDRPGYPDFISHQEPDGSWDVFITETQKTEARLHRIDRALLARLSMQHSIHGHPGGEVLRLERHNSTGSVEMPPLPSFDGSDSAKAGVDGLGLAITLLLANHSLSRAGQTLLSSVRTPNGGGLAVVTGPAAGGLTLEMSDGLSTFNLSTDAACSAALAQPGSHFFGAVADGGPRIATLMVDGVLCDGAGQQDFGWGWFPSLGSVRGASRMAVAPDYGGTIESSRLYDRMLTTSQLVGAFRASVNP